MAELQRAKRIRTHAPLRRRVHKIRAPWVIVYILMILLVCFTALPLVYMVNTAFKPMQELFVFPPNFFVRNPTTKNFVDLVVVMGSSTVPFIRNVVNSIIVSVSIVFLTVMVSTTGAYGLVKFHIPGRKLIFNIVVASLMFSPHVTQIPRYLVVNGLGMINHYSALILPAVASSYNFFLMKQFVEQFPNELLEAGRIDGCGEYRMFFKLVMPALRPAWCTLVVFSFVSSWNDYFTPLIYVTSQAMKTLPLALQTIAGGAAAQSISRAGAVAAATLLMTLPTIVIFTAMQKNVMETMTYSGIKG